MLPASCECYMFIVIIINVKSINTENTKTQVHKPQSGYWSIQFLNTLTLGAKESRVVRSVPDYCTLRTIAGP